MTPLTFHEAVALAAVLAAAGAFAGALVLDVDDGELQELDDGVAPPELANSLDRQSDLGQPESGN